MKVTDGTARVREIRCVGTTYYTIERFRKGSFTAGNWRDVFDTYDTQDSAIEKCKQINDDICKYQILGETIIYPPHLADPLF